MIAEMIQYSWQRLDADETDFIAPSKGGALKEKKKYLNKLRLCLQAASVRYYRAPFARFLNSVMHIFRPKPFSGKLL